MNLDLYELFEADVLEPHLDEKRFLLFRSLVKHSVVDPSLNGVQIQQHTIETVKLFHWQPQQPISVEEILLEAELLVGYLLPPEDSRPPLL